MSPFRCLDHVLGTARESVARTGIAAARPARPVLSVTDVQAAGSIAEGDALKVIV